MRRLANPFLSIEGYHCFGCSPTNPHGLQMAFFETEESVVSYWDPKRRFEGFDSILHGGIQATLMDEIASWYVFVKLKTGGVTSGMSVKFGRPVRTDRGRLRLEARLDRMEKNIAHIRVTLVEADTGNTFEGRDSQTPVNPDSPTGAHSQPAAPPSTGAIASEGICGYFTYPERIARKRLNYPGYQAFIPREPDWEAPQ